jgi:hypothetical protein
MAQARRTLYIVVGSALCLGSALVFYAAAHQWLLTRTEALGHRPNLALIALLGIVALAGGVSLLVRALLPDRANQRAVGVALGLTLCLTAAIGLLYMAQGWVGSISRNDDNIYFVAWAVLGMGSLVVFFAGARAIYDATHPAPARKARTSGARHTPQSIV